jgi:outer membrane autotransporter protein
VRTGNQNLTFNTLAGATVTSNLPFVVAGNRVVTIDPTSFGTTDRTMMDFMRGASAAIPDIDVTASGGAPLAFAAPESADRIGDAFASIPGLAYAGEADVFKSPTALHSDGTAMWARGFLGRRTQDADGIVLGTKNEFYGGMLGGDRQVSSSLRLGLFVGGGETRSDLERNAGGSTSTLVFGGGYARWRVADAFLHLAVQAGHSDNETSRNNINNNLAPGGTESAKGSFNGWYVSPEVHVGVHLPLGTAFGTLYTLTPSARLRYLHASFDGYTETGSTANMTVGSRTAQDLEERGELKLTMTQGLVSTSLYGGVLGVQRIGDTTINASLLGQPLPFAAPGDDNVWGGYGGLGIAWRTARGMSFFGALEYTALSDDSEIVSGHAGLRVAF